MKIASVSVKTKNMARSIEFYNLLGFEFENNVANEQHVENIHKENETKLMIDTEEMLKGILGYEPKSSNCSTFAILYETPLEVNEIATKLLSAGFEIVKEPWDAFWGQRYCIVKDPGGNLIDLYSYIKK